MVSVPGGAKELVTESQYQDVLDHLLAQVMINAEHLVLGPVGCEGALEFSRTAKVFSEGLLDLFTFWLLSVHSNQVTDAYNDPRNAIGWIAVALQMLRDCYEDTRRESHVEYSVSLLAALLQALQVLSEVDERLVVIILARDVGAHPTELLQLLFHILGRSLYV